MASEVQHATVIDTHEELRDESGALYAALDVLGLYFLLFI